VIFFVDLCTEIVDYINMMNDKTMSSQYFSLEAWRAAARALNFRIEQDVYEGNAESGPCPPSGGYVALDRDNNEVGFFNLFDPEPCGALFDRHDD